MKIEDFEGRAPAFLPEEFFDGQTRAWGMFQDRFGRVRRQFTVDIAGEWDGETLTLVEDFVYDDGETERRVWTIRKRGPRRYEGRADGVIGVARGRQAGNAMNWAYDFGLRLGNRTLKVHFDDWMLLQPDGVMINRAAVSKLGFTLGQAIIFFRRQAAADAPGAAFSPQDGMSVAAE